MLPHSRQDLVVSLQAQTNQAARPHPGSKSHSSAPAQSGLFAKRSLRQFVNLVKGAT
jgi:hypothetical protein